MFPGCGVVTVSVLLLLVRRFSRNSTEVGATEVRISSSTTTSTDGNRAGVPNGGWHCLDTQLHTDPVQLENMVPTDTTGSTVQSETSQRQRSVPAPIGI